MARSATVDVAAQIRTLRDMTEFNEAMEVLRSIWAPADGDAPILAELMRAIDFAGGYVAGAFADGAMVGASVGFLADRDGEHHLHSHISGVVPAWQSRNVGLALKQHQRSWAIDRGIDVIEWTFDPLVRRNAYFNLAKLGAAVVGFAPDFYGEMDDEFNAGDFTDRAVVRWDLARSPDGAAQGDDAAVILDDDGDGAPSVSKSNAATLRAFIPEDIVAIRRRDADLAREWRLALRESFGAAVADGYRGVAMTRDGWYTLERSR